MARSGDEGFDQRLDRWVEAGRQFVDGVSGARPGSRGAARGLPRRGSSRLSPGELGRWVENKLEWLLDDEGDDDWREPWQQPQQRPEPRAAGARSPRRRLEAISRRASSPAPTPAPPPSVPRDGAAGGEWPSDDDLRISRWQRDAPPAPDPSPPANDDPWGASAARPLPRSSRRR